MKRIIKPMLAMLFTVAMMIGTAQVVGACDGCVRIDNIPIYGTESLQDVIPFNWNRFLEIRGIQAELRHIYTTVEESTFKERDFRRVDDGDITDISRVYMEQHVFGYCEILDKLFNAGFSYIEIVTFENVSYENIQYKKREFRSGFSNGDNPELGVLSRPCRPGQHDGPIRTIRSFSVVEHNGLFLPCFILHIFEGICEAPGCGAFIFEIWEQEFDCFMCSILVGEPEQLE